MKAYLGLGSNLGDRKEHLVQAMFLLDQQEGIHVLKKSKLYETKPYGEVSQGNYLNAVIEIETSLEPLDLLKKVNAIEKQLKRERTIRWGPRTLDIDILLMDEISMDTPVLTIPHKELTKRSFVLVPLRDVYPTDELFGQSFEKWIKETQNFEDIIDCEESW
ncbi:2-amino-4-hydroxy-6-hydroxymethyldihydropteridine diphosphokinase [Enterococcus faecalis 13-SD-W-01]|nr:2-amino-4-hydroxy-6-hydroxymethyldihydropteridine diphosphokinase [Enterococcus faecalis 13-SD-W-01]